MHIYIPMYLIYFFIGPKHRIKKMKMATRREFTTISVHSEPQGGKSFHGQCLRQIPCLILFLLLLLLLNNDTIPKFKISRVFSVNLWSKKIKSGYNWILPIVTFCWGLHGGGRSREGRQDVRDLGQEPGRQPHRERVCQGETDVNVVQTTKG